MWTDPGIIKNRSQTHECWNWDWGRAIPFFGIHKEDIRCSVQLYISCTFRLRPWQGPDQRLDQICSSWESFQPARADTVQNAAYPSHPSSCPVSTRQGNSSVVFALAYLNCTIQIYKIYGTLIGMHEAGMLLVIQIISRSCNNPTENVKFLIKFV